jgi:iron complex outermembrane receptor protein
MIEGLAIGGRFGWLESQFLDFADTRVTAVPAQQTADLILANVVVDFTGNRLPNTPRFKASGNVEWTFDLGRFGALIPRYDVSWTDDVFFDPTQGRGVNQYFGDELLPKYAVGQREYWIHDARVTYRFPSSRIEVAGWVRNFTDTVYKTFVADTSIAFGSLQNLIGDPRTYGVSVSFLY